MTRAGGNLTKWTCRAQSDMSHSTSKPTFIYWCRYFNCSAQQHLTQSGWNSPFHCVALTLNSEFCGLPKIKKKKKNRRHIRTPTWDFLHGFWETAALWTVPQRSQASIHGHLARRGTRRCCRTHSNTLSITCLAVSAKHEPHLDPFNWKFTGVASTAIKNK